MPPIAIPLSSSRRGAEQVGQGRGLSARAPGRRVLSNAQRCGRASRIPGTMEGQRVHVDGTSRSHERGRRYGLITALLVAAIASTILVLVQRPIVQNEHAMEKSVAMSEEFIEALSQGRTEVVRSMLSSDAEVSINPARSPDDIEMTMAWMEATGWTLGVDRCAAFDRGTAGGSQRVLCRLTQENAWSRVLEVPPDTRGALTFEVAEDRIVSALLSFAPMSFKDRSVNTFEAWLAEHHPEDVRSMYVYEWLPSLSEESVELWGRHTDEFVAEKS